MIKLLKNKLRTLSNRFKILMIFIFPLIVSFLFLATSYLTDVRLSSYINNSAVFKWGAYIFIFCGVGVVSILSLNFGNKSSQSIPAEILIKTLLSFSYISVTVPFTLYINFILFCTFVNKQCIMP